MFFVLLVSSIVFGVRTVNEYSQPSNDTPYAPPCLMLVEEEDLTPYQTLPQGKIQILQQINFGDSHMMLIEEDLTPYQARLLGINQQLPLQKEKFDDVVSNILKENIKTPLPESAHKNSPFLEPPLSQQEISITPSKKNYSPPPKQSKNNSLSYPKSKSISQTERFHPPIPLAFETALQEHRYSYLIRCYHSGKVPSLKEVAHNWQIKDTSARKYINQDLIHFLERQHVDQSIQNFFRSIANQPLGFISQ